MAGVPFHSNVFGEAATQAEASRVGGAKPVPGAPRDVYIGHASVVMWVDGSGESRYAAAVALHSLTFSMSMDRCRAQNDGDRDKCTPVFDAPTPVLAVIKASDGGYFFMAGNSKSAARKRGLEACMKRPNVSCKVDKVYGSSGGFLDF